MKWDRGRSSVPFFSLKNSTFLWVSTFTNWDATTSPVPRPLSHVPELPAQSPESQLDHRNRTCDNLSMTKHYCYILECSDGSYYTGYSTDPKRRLKEHNSTSKGAKYTRARRPCKLVYIEEFDSKSEAEKREYYIKHNMTRIEKEALISAAPQVQTILCDLQSKDS